MTLFLLRDLPSGVTYRITRGDAAMRRILKASALLAAVTLVAVTGAGAAVSPSYQVTGIEFGAPQSNTNQFTGLGTGTAGDRASWQASITHDPLAGCTTVGSKCAITGGTFTLRNNTGSQLGGNFTDGTLQLSTAAPGCGSEQFALTGDFTSDEGPQTLTAVVTYVRFRLGGRCVVLASVLQGTLGTGLAA
jgi:hypothetical protein